MFVPWSLAKKTANYSPNGYKQIPTEIMKKP